MEQTDLELYIQIRDGQPHEHPIFADNLKLAFPDVDINNLPKDQFAKFIRVSQPELGTFEVYEGVTYEWDGDVIKDVHSVRPMNEVERAAKIEVIKVSAENVRKARIEHINGMIASEESTIAKDLWGKCLAEHEAWQYDESGPDFQIFPPFPSKDESGNWVAP